jgi:hypothetical protein
MKEKMAFGKLSKQKRATVSCLGLSPIALPATSRHHSCKYGTGVLEVTDALNNQVVYNEKPEFLGYLSLKFKMDDAGKVTFEGKDEEYENSWEQAEDVANYPQTVDQFWPGVVPIVRGALNVNVKYDRFPEHIKWAFAKKGSNGDYTDLTSFDGAVDGITNDLLVTEILANQLGEGWYRFKITDSSSDGLCCEFRRGWVTLTGFLKATRNSGMIWGSNGEFGAGVEIYIKMDAKGYAVRTTDNASAAS